jgi:hypothetical protein
MWGCMKVLAAHTAVYAFFEGKVCGLRKLLYVV